jgi:hypothetical protein
LDGFDEHNQKTSQNSSQITVPNNKKIIEKINQKHFGVLKKYMNVVGNATC